MSYIDKTMNRSHSGKWESRIYSYLKLLGNLPSFFLPYKIWAKPLRNGNIKKGQNGEHPGNNLF